MILAMAYAQCGRQATAREILARLPEGREREGSLERDLLRLRREAERLLSTEAGTIPED